MRNAVGDMTIRVVIGVNGKIEATSIEPSPTLPAPLVETSAVTVPIPFHFRVSPYDGPTVGYGSGPSDPGY